MRKQLEMAIWHLVLESALAQRGDDQEAMPVLERHAGTCGAAHRESMPPAKQTGVQRPPNLVSPHMRRSPDG